MYHRLYFPRRIQPRVIALSSEEGLPIAPSPIGRELYYLSPDGKLMAVSVRHEPTFAPGVPVRLFDGPAMEHAVAGNDRFLIEYHASTHGYYLEALVIFGGVTGRDPRSLGQNECSAYEVGLSRSEAKALQQIAFDQLASTGAITAAPLLLPKPVNPERCVAGR